MTFCEMHKNDGGCQECPNRWVCKDSTLKTSANGSPAPAAVRASGIKKSP